MFLGTRYIQSCVNWLSEQVWKKLQKKKESIEFIHKPKDSDCDISQLEAKVESLTSNVAEISVKISNLEKELK